MYLPKETEGKRERESERKIILNQLQYSERIDAPPKVSNTHLCTVRIRVTV